MEYYIIATLPTVDESLQMYLSTSFAYIIICMTSATVVVVLQTEYTCQITGLAWNLKTSWTKCGATWCPYYPLTGKQEIAFGFNSLSSTPKEIVIKVGDLV